MIYYNFKMVNIVKKLTLCCWANLILVRVLFLEVNNNHCHLISMNIINDNCPRDKPCTGR